MLQVAACSAERACGAMAMLKVIVTSSLDFFDGNFVFILTSVIITQSLCDFLLIEPIFSSLSLCWSNSCWFDCFSRLGFHFPFLQVLVWGNRCCHFPIFFLGLPIALLVLSLELRSELHSAAFFQSSFTRWNCNSQCQLPFHFLWVLFQHRIFARSILSNASTVLLFM